MNPLLELTDPPELSDKAAVQVLDFLHELATAFENHYAGQLYRYHASLVTPQPDLFDDIDNNSPPF